MVLTFWTRICNRGARKNRTFEVVLKVIQSRDQTTMAHQESKKRKGNTDIDNNDSESAESGVFTTFVDLTSQYKCQDFNDIAQCFITLHQNISKDFTSITTKLSDVKAEL